MGDQWRGSAPIRRRVSGTRNDLALFGLRGTVAVVGTGWQPLENASATDLQGANLLETAVVFHTLHRVFHRSATLMGRFFCACSVTFYISFCQHFRVDSLQTGL